LESNPALHFSPALSFANPSSSSASSSSSSGSSEQNRTDEDLMNRQWPHSIRDSASDAQRHSESSYLVMSPATQFHVYSQYNDASCWIPCLDTLADRCTWELDISTDPKFHVFASAKKISSELLSISSPSLLRLRRNRFKSDFPFSVRSLAFCVALSSNVSVLKLPSHVSSIQYPGASHASAASSGSNSSNINIHSNNININSNNISTSNNNTSNNSTISNSTISNSSTSSSSTRTSTSNGSSVGGETVVNSDDAMVDDEFLKGSSGVSEENKSSSSSSSSMVDEPSVSSHESKAGVGISSGGVSSVNLQDSFLNRDGQVSCLAISCAKLNSFASYSRKLANPVGPDGASPSFAQYNPSATVIENCLQASVGSVFSSVAQMAEEVTHSLWPWSQQIICFIEEPNEDYISCPG